MSTTESEKAVGMLIQAVNMLKEATEVLKEARQEVDAYREHYTWDMLNHGTV